MNLFLDLMNFGCCCCCDVKLMFIMKATTTSPLHESGVYCSFSYGKCHYVRGDNNRVNLQELVRGGTDWVELALDSERWRAYVDVGMKLWFP